MPKIIESDMEAAIEADLLSSGYFRREPEHYDKSLCLDPEMLVNFLIATQPEKWEAYRSQLGDRARDTLLSKVKSEIDNRGTLELLRKPFPSYGVYFDFVFFKPASSMNESYRKKYQGNIFSVMRQVRYSVHNENSLDMVLFLNGIPLAVMELKDRMTGSGYNVENAMKQYRENRDSREPLFKFGRCLVHFAVDEELVYMTTHLRNGKTFFLPFNRGNNGEAGNPPTEGFSTEYLWKEALQKDSFLELLQNYIQMTDVFDEDGKPTGEKQVVFPRYHQMDAVRTLVAHAKKHGTGQQYLIQHSAGSGKSNTISWLAHQLSNLHDMNDTNVFDSIIVVTDRKVLDSQLRAIVLAFEQQPGVVAGIDKGSRHLKQELEAGTKIIVTTLQKFPYIEEEVKSLPGKRFAIILDEAYSSSSGEMSKSLKRVLNMNAEDDPEEEVWTWEDEIDEQIKKRGRQPNISYFAFTATPKPKTLELFGEKQADGSFRPFHVYSMKQAIQEEFIKDVLPNYTTYFTFFQLIKKITSDPNYDKGKATRLLKTFVEMSEHTIERKTAIIIEHFLENCSNEMPDKNGKGQAKAMMVCSSRAQAVKYKRAFDTYLSERDIHFKTLVAFSGTIEDEETNEEFSETRMNGFPEEQTVSRFKENQYKFLIVADKFQTGFDQPKLYAMYVNKPLKGVNAVQTLSRLNRVYPSKGDPITIDFVNEAKVIQKAFQDFYENTMLEEGSDPDKLYDFKRSLEVFLYYTQNEVNRFAEIFFTKPLRQDRLNPILNVVIDRFNGDNDRKDRQDKFRAVLKAYLRVYAFLAQILPFSDIELEKLYVFGRILLRKLPYTKQQLPREVTQQVDLDSISIRYISRGVKVKSGEGGVFQPGDENPMGDSNEFLEPLSIIIKAINEKYATDFNDTDRVVADSLLSRLVKDEEFEQEVKVNPEQAVWWSFKKKFNAKLQDMIEEHFDFYKKLNNNPEIKEEMMKHMFKVLYNQIIKKAG